MWSIIGWLWHFCCAVVVHRGYELPEVTPSSTRCVALCYVRQSFTRDENDTSSPDRQRANIEAMLAGSGLRLEWYEDVDGHKSGATVTGRPKWQALEARLADLDVAVLIANDLSRLHRKGWRIGALVEMVEAHSVRLILAAPGRQIDLGTPLGRLLIQFIAMIDEYYVIDARIRQQDNARRRRERGITTGNPPFATYRGDGGYLERTRRGAWFLPDAHFVVGVPETCPVAGAVWRPYAETALHILTHYATSSLGYENIAYKLQAEGWPFEDRKDVPRLVTGDDVWRVLSNWPEYAGLVGGHRAKDRTQHDLTALQDMTFNEDRAIFPTDILRQVAQRQKGNKERLHNTQQGVTHESYAYPLRALLRCAACERNAVKQQDPRLRSALGGTDQNGVKRYRHKSGVFCGCAVRSVRCEPVEEDFVRLLTTLQPRKGLLSRLLGIAHRVAPRAIFQRTDSTQRRQHALQRVERQIAALQRQYQNGVTAASYYAQRLAEYEHTRAELLTQVVPAMPPPFDLAACLGMLEHLDTLWHLSSPEQKQDLTQNLFESIIYDLEQQRIVAYTLTAWAQVFLTVPEHLDLTAKLDASAL